MPELPEVETTRRGIEPALKQHRVLEVVVRERRLRWPVPKDFESRLIGERVLAVERRAKYILIRVASGTVILHLGMSGSVRLVKPDTPPRKHDHVDFVMDSGWVVRFHDPRRFGSLSFTAEDPERHQLLKNLAPEPLSAKFDGDYLFRITRKRKVAIKQLIMNSQLVVGVGNIYASEALFRARISPKRVACRISAAEAEKLAKAIKTVLAAAVKIGGTTLRDYVNADGEAGYFKQRLYVYERAGAQCRVCKAPVKQFTQGQRSTYWCTICQR
ncbi:MAG TPA: bifunctional DNA-formamidopyrimidine glycosylase/DNA-(apurinic or apyrimidinic site) lyase [Steroidobacteraceae bacterium]